MALDRMIDLVGQRERELASRIDVQDEDGAFTLSVFRDCYAPDFVCAVQLIHDLFADRGDLRNAVGGEDGMSIRAGVGDERQRAADATVHDRGEVAGDDVRCIVGRQIVGVIIRRVVVVFVAVAVGDVNRTLLLLNLKPELFFLDQSVETVEGERDEGVFREQRGRGDRELDSGSSSGGSRSSGLPVNKPSINGP